MGEAFMFSQRHKHVHFYRWVFRFGELIVASFSISFSLSRGLTFNSSISEIEMSLSCAGTRCTRLKQSVVVAFRSPSLYWQLLLWLEHTLEHRNEFERTCKRVAVCSLRTMVHDSWIFCLLSSTRRQKKVEQVNQSLIHQSFVAWTVNEAYETLIEFNCKVTRRWGWDE